MTADADDQQVGAEQPAGKGDATRRLIVDTSMKLFTERGYDKTTMRAIAAEAGLSVGNAYYYFGSKEHLIQGVYDQIQAEHHTATREVLASTSAFGVRLAGVLHAWIEVAEPYREFAEQLFKTAADPRSPLNPFSADSQGARDTAIALMHEVVDGSAITVEHDLRERLPELLWTMQMGMVLFWVYDSSPTSDRTMLLIDRSVPMVERLLKLSRLPVLRSTSREFVALLDKLGLSAGPPAPRTPG